MNEFIIIVGQYFTRRDEYRYGVEIFQKQGYKLSIWDISGIAQPGSIDHIIKNCGDYAADYITRFNNVSEIVKMIHDIKGELCFITMMVYDRNTRRIFRAISSNGYEYFCTGPYSVGIFPDFVNARRVNIPGKLWFFRKEFIKRQIRKITHFDMRIPIKYFGIKYARAFALAGGSNSTVDGPLVGPDTKVERIHAADYDFFLQAEKQADTDNGSDYIVYIDQAIAVAADAYARGKQLDIDPEKYYGDLAAFFDLVEEHFQKPVIIAAHPKANYEQLGYSFGKHEVRSGYNSAEIVADASFVLLHYSTAINLAIVFDKPIMFLTSDVLEAYKKPFIDGLTRFFGVTPLNINQSDLKIPPVQKDAVRYRQYFEQYIKAPGTLERPFWEQVITLVDEIE